MTETQIYQNEELLYWLESQIGDWFFVFAGALLIVELIRYALKKEITKHVLGDVLTNFATLALFIGTGLLYFGAYVTGFYWLWEYSLFNIELGIASFIACLILADFAYYWEHRFMHRTGIGWATHTVHHSSKHFNISVAYRFGPLDGIMPFFFHAPLILLGFSPALVILAEALVQLYQTLLHTETVKKLPKPYEAVFNTPSHHRVHHGVNEQYHDKNYAGILIIWDKLFGTFKEEGEKVCYGVMEQSDRLNPLTVWFEGFPKLYTKIKNKGVKALILPPGE